MHREKLRRHLLFIVKVVAYGAYRAQGAARLRCSQLEVVEAVPEHSEPMAVTTAVAATRVFHPGELSFEPLSLQTSLQPSFHWWMSLNCDLPPILGRVLADDQLAVDHRLHRRHAAATIDDLSTSCRRQQAPVASWTSGAARRRAGAQLCDGAVVLEGGDWRG